MGARTGCGPTRTEELIAEAAELRGCAGGIKPDGDVHRSPQINIMIYNVGCAQLAAMYQKSPPD